MQNACSVFVLEPIPKLAHTVPLGLLCLRLRHNIQIERATPPGARFPRPRRPSLRPRMSKNIRERTFSNAPASGRQQCRHGCRARGVPLRCQTAAFPCRPQHGCVRAIRVPRLAQRGARTGPTVLAAGRGDGGGEMGEGGGSSWKRVL